MRSHQAGTSLVQVAGTIGGGRIKFQKGASSANEMIPSNLEFIHESTGVLEMAQKRITDEGEFEFMVFADPGREIAIERSNDLNNWLEATNFVNQASLTPVRFNGPENGGHQFFRAVVK